MRVFGIELECFSKSLCRLFEFARSCKRHAKIDPELDVPAFQCNGLAKNCSRLHRIAMGQADTRQVFAGGESRSLLYSLAQLRAGPFVISELLVRKAQIVARVRFEGGPRNWKAAQDFLPFAELFQPVRRFLKISTLVAYLAEKVSHEKIIRLDFEYSRCPLMRSIRIPLHEMILGKAGHSVYEEFAPALPPLNLHKPLRNFDGFFPFSEEGVRLAEMMKDVKVGRFLREFFLEQRCVPPRLIPQNSCVLVTAVDDGHSGQRLKAHAMPLQRRRDLFMNSALPSYSLYIGEKAELRELGPAGVGGARQHFQEISLQRSVEVSPQRRNVFRLDPVIRIEPQDPIRLRVCQSEVPGA